MTEKCQQILLQENKEMRENIAQEKKQLFDEIINNEFCHISEYEELQDTNDNKEIVEADSLVKKITDEIFKIVDFKLEELVDDLQTAEIDYWTLIARYYFKKGVEAGIKNLNFTKILI